MFARLDGMVDSLEAGEVSLVLCEPSDYNRVLKILTSLLGNTLGGIWVTVDKTHGHLREMLGEVGVDPSSFFFVDSVSSLAGQDESGEGYVLVRGPSSLTDISVEVSRLLDDGYDFLLFSSLSTLREYNDRRGVISLIQQMSSRLRLAGLRGVLLALKGQHSNTINAIIPFCDIVLDLGESPLDRAASSWGEAFRGR